MTATRSPPRVGNWPESIASNAKSAAAAKDSKDLHDQLHAMDYLVYAHLQLGQEKKAQAVLAEMTSVAGPAEAKSGNGFLGQAAVAQILQCRAALRQEQAAGRARN